MAISNELSSEIAAALLDKKKTPSELKQLRELILQIHTTLQKMQQHTSPKSSTPMAKAAKQSAEE